MGKFAVTTFGAAGAIIRDNEHHRLRHNFRGRFELAEGFSFITYPMKVSQSSCLSQADWIGHCLVGNFYSSLKNCQSKLAKTWTFIAKVEVVQIQDFSVERFLCLSPMIST